jgi:hypothetical protein
MPWLKFSLCQAVVVAGSCCQAYKQASEVPSKPPAIIVIFVVMRAGHSSFILILTTVTEVSVVLAGAFHKAGKSQTRLGQTRVRPRTTGQEVARCECWLSQRWLRRERRNGAQLRESRTAAFLSKIGEFEFVQSEMESMRA